MKTYRLKSDVYQIFLVNSHHAETCNNLICLLAPQCVAWHSEDKAFAAGYPSGKILLSTTETYENEQPVVLSLFQVCHPHSL